VVKCPIDELATDHETQSDLAIIRYMMSTSRHCLRTYYLWLFDGKIDEVQLINCIIINEVFWWWTIMDKMHGVFQLNLNQGEIHYLHHNVQLLILGRVKLDTTGFHSDQKFIVVTRQSPSSPPFCGFSSFKLGWNFPREKAHFLHYFLQGLFG
jgi:hypothetical protein